MEIILLFFVMLGAGEVASEGVPQQEWGQPRDLITYYRPQAIPDMCPHIEGVYIQGSPHV